MIVVESDDSVVGWADQAMGEYSRRVDELRLTLSVN